MTNILKENYKNKITKNLKAKYNYQNPHQVPKLVKIQINRGLGLAAQNKNVLQKTVDEFRIITGQQPIITKAKKSIAGFKTREGMALGVTVTLRNEMMYAFLERFINLVLPRIRDFRGLKIDGFDKKGNYNIGLREQLVFPEIDYNQIDQSRGFNISFVTTAETTDERRGEKASKEGKGTQGAARVCRTQRQSGILARTGWSRIKIKVS
jgi:large subunit ribosomal protein L5